MLFRHKIVSFLNGRRSQEGIKNAPPCERLVYQDATTAVTMIAFQTMRAGGGLSDETIEFVLVEIIFPRLTCFHIGVVLWVSVYA